MTSPAGSDSTDTVHCAACGATNRVARARMRPGVRAVCGRCKTPLESTDGPVTVTDATFASVVAASPLPVLLDLWAPWCGPCHMVGPVVDQLAGELAGRVRVGKLNVDENPATASQFGVRSIPTLLILRGGRELDRLVGVMPKEEILSRLEDVM